MKQKPTPQFKETRHFLLEEDIYNDTRLLFFAYFTWHHDASVALFTCRLRRFNATQRETVLQPDVNKATNNDGENPRTLFLLYIVFSVEGTLHPESVF